MLVGLPNETNGLALRSYEKTGRLKIVFLCEFGAPACQTGASWRQQPSCCGEGDPKRIKKRRLGFSNMGLDDWLTS